MTLARSSTRRPDGASRATGRVSSVVLALAMSVVFAISASGCSATSRGVGAYRGGHYLQALQSFRSGARHWRDQSTEGRLDYALYRGLTHLELGDRDGARYWLASAWAIGQERPTLMDGERLLDWRRGWAELHGHASDEP